MPYGTTTRLWLAAHGERGGAGDDAGLKALGQAVAAAFPDVLVSALRVSDADAVTRALTEAGDAPIACLPLLFSDGFFYANRLAPHFQIAPRRVLAPPLVGWAGFPDALAAELRARAGESFDGHALLVAHGSRETGRSAACARDLAEVLARSGLQVETAFLEEAPFAAKQAKAMIAPWAAIGLFFGSGLHGRDDFAEAVAAAPSPPVAAFLAGEMTSLPALVLAEARRQLARLEPC